MPWGKGKKDKAGASQKPSSGGPIQNRESFLKGKGTSDSLKIDHLFRKEGIRFYRYYKKGKVSQVHLVADKNTFIIKNSLDVVSGIPALEGPPVNVDIAQIREVRYGDAMQPLLCEDFGPKKKVHMYQYALVILYGDQFVLNQLCLAAGSEDDYVAFTEGLERVIRPQFHSHPDRSKHIGDHKWYEHQTFTKRWLNAQFAHYDVKNIGRVSIGDIKKWASAVQLKMTSKSLTDHFHVIGEEGDLDRDGFEQLYHTLLAEGEKHLVKHFKEEEKLSVDDFSMSKEEVLNFLRQTNKNKYCSMEECVDIMREFQQLKKDASAPRFDIYCLIEYLFSVENDVWNNKDDRISRDDMNSPLTHYW
eukprot:UC4_evm4s355